MNRPKLDLCVRLGVICCLLSATMSLPAWAQKWNRYGPGTRSQASGVYDPVTNTLFSFAGQHAPTNIDFNDVWAAQNVIPSSTATHENLQWIRVSVSGKQPTDRFGQSAVYNQTTNRMITFGGGTGFPGPCINELWVITHLNGVGGSPLWIKEAPTGTLPPVREGHTAVYDPNTNKMIVFGGTDCNGNYYNDLWILSNADGSTATPSWAEVTPIGTPPSARTQATAIYDSVNNVMTVYGGGTTSTNVFGDVWTLTNANGATGTPTWTQVSPKGTAPAARVGHSAVYDSADNRMVIFGGGNNHGKVLNDGWILTFANNIGGTPTWSQATFADTAPNRESHEAIYDSVSGDMAIFGGDSSLPKTFTDDHVYILTNANGLTSGADWTQDGPAPRLHTSAIYDSATDQMVVFGGDTATGPIGDVWSSPGLVAAGQTVTTTPYKWIQVFPTGTAPSARYGHAAAYDGLGNHMMLFGGGTSATACLNDSWVLDDANSADGVPSWVQLSPSGTLPSPRMNFTNQYDPTTNSLIIFGGANCAAGYLSDVWVLSNANGGPGTPTWSQLSPTGTAPSARENASAIYDSTNNVLTLYAGDSGSVGLSDVWTLSNANGTGGTPTWTHIVPTGTAPAARTGQSSVYDSKDNRMIMYGGNNSLTGTAYYEDTWILTFANGIGGTPAWISEKVSGTAPQRHFHSAFYSSADNDLIIFGGESMIAQSPWDDRTFILSVANDL
jgi:fructose-specific component phosphotransferase system IIB-like protein